MVGPGLLKQARDESWDEMRNALRAPVYSCTRVVMSGVWILYSDSESLVQRGLICRVSPLDNQPGFQCPGVNHG